MFLQEYYTLDMRCEYKADMTFMETTYIRKGGTNNVWCYCEVFKPNICNGTSTHLNIMALEATCSLVITRCPLTQSLFY